MDKEIERPKRASTQARRRLDPQPAPGCTLGKIRPPLYVRTLVRPPSEAPDDPFGRVEPVEHPVPVSERSAVLTSLPDAAQRAGITPRQARRWLELGLVSAVRPSRLSDRTRHATVPLNWGTWRRGGGRPLVSRGNS
jgi:hypothetical protein